MATTELSNVTETTDNLENADFLLVVKNGETDVKKVKQKEIDGINQVPQINLTNQTTTEINLLNGINSNFVINLSGSTQTAVSITFKEPANSNKKVAKRIYFRVKPHATNDIDISFPNSSPTFVKFMTPFSSTKTIPAGTGGASELHFVLHLEAGWSIGRITHLV